MTQVLIAASTPALRAGLRALLTIPEMQVVSEVSTLAGQALELAGVDVVVVADADLLADAARVVTDDGRLSIVVLSEDDQVASTLRKLPLYGWGIVPPDAAAAELQAAVRAAAQGLIVLPLPFLNRLLDQRQAGSVLAEPLPEPLTAREREVLELVSQGLSNKLIARTLQISEHTVKFHVSSIYTKLGASSRTEAVSRGARYGLITL